MVNLRCLAKKAWPQVSGHTTEPSFLISLCTEVLRQGTLYEEAARNGNLVGLLRRRAPDLIIAVARTFPLSGQRRRAPATGGDGATMTSLRGSSARAWLCDTFLLALQ